jgi:predicted 2-oxoglutarate/Fe(II)-dependent dioxygenase YbiX
MFTYIPDLLSAEESDRLMALLGKAGFADGALTAGWNAKLVKKNEQLDRSGPRSPATPPSPWRCVPASCARSCSIAMSKA